MAPLRIHRYDPCDRETVWDLHLLGLAQTGADVGRGPWDDLKRIETEYLAPGGEFLVGEHDGRVVAMGGFRRLTSLEAELKRIRVHPDFQRRGFGQAILVELEGGPVPPASTPFGSTRLFHSWLRLGCITSMDTARSE